MFLVFFNKPEAKMSRRKISMLEVEEVLYRWVDGMPQRTINRSLGLSRNTIKEMINKAQKFGLQIGESDKDKIKAVCEEIESHRQNNKKTKYPVEVKLEPYKMEIELWLLEPYMTVKQMWRLLLEKEPPVCIGINSLHRYIKKHFNKISAVTMVLHTEPGKQAQVDFGYVGLMKEAGGDKHRKTYAFIMTLSYSRHRFVYFVFKQDTKTWIDCHIRAFAFFGGVPKTILLDNLKAGILKADIYDPVLNKAYAELEHHYGFIADPAKVRMPEHKGKVERSVTIVKQQIVSGRKFENINSANQYARNWAEKDIGYEITRTTGEAPMVMFLRDEKDKLLCLPKNIFECPTWTEVKVGRDQHASVFGSFYSLPEKYIEKKLSVRLSGKTIQFYLGLTCVKMHCVASRKGEWVTDIKDLHKGAQEYIKITPEYCFEEARKNGEATLTFIQMMLEKSSITRLRKAKAVLELAQDYGSTRLEAACKRAMTYNNLEYKSLVRILDNHLDSQPNIGGHFLSKESLSEGAYLRDASEFMVD